MTQDQAKELNIEAVKRNHAQINVIFNLKKFYTDRLKFVAHAIGREFHIDPLSLGVSLLDAANTADKILDARAEFFAGLQPYFPTKFKGKDCKMQLLCKDCDTFGCPNGDPVITVAMTMKELNDL